MERNICGTCGEYADECTCGDAAAKLAKWEAYPQRFVCADCGWGVKADEDGCCAMCGRECAIVAVMVEPQDMRPSLPDGVHIRRPTLQGQLLRIEGFAAMERGWLAKDEGEPGDRAAIDVARRFLAGICEADAALPLPAVFPMPDGGVQIEWRTCEIRFPPGGLLVRGCGVVAGHDFDGTTDAVTPADVALRVRACEDHVGRDE